MSDLTPNQRLAVEHFEGPLLVLAGPGSGKTRVITHRIARLVERGVPPWQILAITFTNKAAREMASRVELLLPGQKIWVSTFHSFCARLLRQHSRVVGLQPNYTILDMSDQRRLLKGVLASMSTDTTLVPIGKVAARISAAKNRLIGPDEFSSSSLAGGVGDFAARIISDAYRAYQAALRESNAVDFDDLLLYVADLLSENPELRSQLDDRFRYILVDEYQDTNLPQYRIVSALSQEHQNLCVTGDPDQSIYAWRGAEIGNILRFEQDYPDATVVRLEHNFRSTQAILREADSLISHNRHRKEKRLITENCEGAPVELLGYPDGYAEADGIAHQIRTLVEDAGRNWSDFAIFYRVNSLSRNIELALARQRIPYQIAAGAAFFERTEVKDVVAYLRLIVNPADRTAFERVVNKPRRGIGKTSLSRLNAWAVENRVRLLEAAGRADEIPRMTKRAAGALRKFAALIESLASNHVGGVSALIQAAIEKTDYAKTWEGVLPEQRDERIANIDELVSAARQYDDMQEEEATLEGFLEESALVSDVDKIDSSAGAVTMMTLHAAKGLEFPVVFVVGVELNLLPHERSLKSDDPKDVEEERRLLFVGMTRAEEQLFLTQTRSRIVQGRRLESIPSPFLREMNLTTTMLDTEFVDEPYQADFSWMSDSSSEPPIPLEEESQIENSTEKTTERPKLMTGADLLNGTASPVELPQGFGMGMKVRHPRYGVGTVIEIHGIGRRKKAAVEFANGDCRDFVIDKSPLQPIGLR